MNCYCGSKKEYEECCQPVIEGNKKIETPEELLRARFSAYKSCQVDFVVKTQHPDMEDKVSLEDAKAWAEETSWENLQIVKQQGGGANDQEARIEFKAYFKQNGIRTLHHELSLFARHEGQWFFRDAQQLHKPVKRESPRVGRNEPCPCGSGKKYKKCCGKN